MCLVKGEYNIFFENFIIFYKEKETMYGFSLIFIEPEFPASAPD